MAALYNENIFEKNSPSEACQQLADPRETGSSCARQQWGSAASGWSPGPGVYDCWSFCSQCVGLNRRKIRLVEIKQNVVILKIYL